MLVRDGRHAGGGRLAVGVVASSSKQGGHAAKTARTAETTTATAATAPAATAETAKIAEISALPVSGSAVLGREKFLDETRNGFGVGIFQRINLDGVDAGTDGVQGFDDLGDAPDV